MTSVATKVIQTVKPHIRMIKFKNQAEASASSGIPQTLHQPQPQTSQSSNSKPIGNTSRGSGIDYTALPERYRRKPLDDIEIEYILRGGPE